MHTTQVHQRHVKPSLTVFRTVCVLAPDLPFMLVLPYVAICEEKAATLDKLLAVKGQHVQRAFGGQSTGQLIGEGVGE